MKLKAKYSLIGGIVAAAVLGIIFMSPGMVGGIPHDIATNATATTPYNVTEIQASVTSYDSAYSLYIYAPQNTSAPMLRDFTISMASPGNSSYVVKFNGVATESGTFAWQKNVKENTSLNGEVLVNVIIASRQANIRKNFSYILKIMSPVTYINYEHTKISVFAQFSATQFLEAFASGALVIYAFSKLFRQGYAKPAAKDAMKNRGLIRSG